MPRFMPAGNRIVGRPFGIQLRAGVSAGCSDRCLGPAASHAQKHRISATSTPAQRPRLNRNTACSPNRFQNHHGIFSRMRRPQALSATASSILAPDT
jgi:hypothetical protein